MVDYSRIQYSVDMKLIKKTHIVIVGAGGAYTLITSLARCGVGKLTVLDFDIVESTNIVRQGYKVFDIGKFKVDALTQEIQSINPEVEYQGITQNFLEMDTVQLDAIFENADLLLFLTDSFKAQAFGNILALRYNKPALWAGWYANSRMFELFFQIPEYTTACFRCAASSRYKANEVKEVKISSNSNTIFHSQLLDSFIGMMSLVILHRSKENRMACLSLGPIGIKEYDIFFDLMKEKDATVHYNFFQFKAHPFSTNQLFSDAYDPLAMHSHNFVSYWQKADAELKINGYDYDCPDCNGILHNLTLNPKT